MVSRPAPSAPTSPVPPSPDTVTFATQAQVCPSIWITPSTPYSSCAYRVTLSPPRQPFSPLVHPTFVREREYSLKRGRKSSTSSALGFATSANDMIYQTFPQSSYWQSTKGDEIIYSTKHSELADAGSRLHDFRSLVAGMRASASLDGLQLLDSPRDGRVARYAHEGDHAAGVDPDAMHTPKIVS
ncbi:hypothetical protein K488DRAFT_87763 [Vararia minispora EC-137]|uniref:Uncharacterized protein n=1 Tax=Vararia minispora EC-137 TaxID=1314806 RepID=A0ACB8QFL0_9AGAM|nr:hypothetical protein K488DRAFT_87763 [Vararia minispora EC-137]